MEKNKRENKSNVHYFLGKILTNKLVIVLIIIAAIGGGVSFGVKKLLSLTAKQPSLVLKI